MILILVPDRKKKVEEKPKEGKTVDAQEQNAK
jgi:hypothetical protein